MSSTFQGRLGAVATRLSSVFVAFDNLRLLVRVELRR
jgi:hypothetical protein